jgi:hypothetical protein
MSLFFPLKDNTVSELQFALKYIPAWVCIPKLLGFYTYAHHSVIIGNWILIINQCDFFK